MIHVIVGDGKGKTSAAAGLSIRAAGHGRDVLFIQFLKDGSSGEIQVLRSVPGISVMLCPVNYGFTYQMTEAQKRETAEAYRGMLDQAIRSEAFLIVLDEAIHALNAGMVERDQLEKLMAKECEIVLTGQNAPAWLMDQADYISDVRKLKHPYDRGVQARAGIEF